MENKYYSPSFFSYFRPDHWFFDSIGKIRGHAFTIRTKFHQLTKVLYIDNKYATALEII